MRSIFQNKALTAIIILLLAANLGVLIYYAFFKDRSSSRGKHPVTEFVKNELNFDEKQMKVFEENKPKNKERIRQLLAETAKAKDSFYQLVLTPDLDDSLLFDRALAVGEKQQAVEMEFFRIFKNLQAQCKPEQLAKFDAGFMNMVKKLYNPKRK